MADTDARPVNQEALVADIDRTRAELARTIDAISDRVNPKKNVNRTMGEVRQRVNEVGQRVNQQVGQRANQVGQRVNQQVGQRASQVDPLVAGAAAAAILVGVAVLFLVRRRSLHPARGARPASTLVSSSYSAAESRSDGSAASPLPSWAMRTRNIHGRVRFGVDQRGVVLEFAVDLDDLAVHRGVQIAQDLTDSTSPQGSPAVTLAPVVGSRVNHVAELLGRVFGDADRGRSPVDRNPLVLGGVAQIGWNTHRYCLLR